MRRAVDALLEHLASTSGGGWTVERWPDDESQYQEKPSPDAVILHPDNITRAAVEVTWFDWPIESLRERKALQQAANELGDAGMNTLAGDFFLHVDLQQLKDSALLDRRTRSKTLSVWIDRFVSEAAVLEAGARLVIDDRVGAYVTRLTDEGPLSVSSGGGMLLPDQFARLHELEGVMHKKAQKFSDFPCALRFLLIDIPVSEELLRLFIPKLSVPAEIDELYFLIRDGGETKIMKRDPEATLPPGLTVDRHTSRITIQVPRYEA